MCHKLYDKKDIDIQFVKQIGGLLVFGKIGVEPGEHKLTVGDEAAVRWVALVGRSHRSGGVGQKGRLGEKSGKYSLIFEGEENIKTSLIQVVHC